MEIRPNYGKHRHRLTRVNPEELSYIKLQPDRVHEMTEIPRSVV